MRLSERVSEKMSGGLSMSARVGVCICVAGGTTPPIWPPGVPTDFWEGRQLQTVLRPLTDERVNEEDTTQMERGTGKRIGGRVAGLNGQNKGRKERRKSCIKKESKLEKRLDRWKKIKQ